MKQPRKVDAAIAIRELNNRYDTVKRYLYRLNLELPNDLSVRIGHAMGEECPVVDYRTNAGTMTFRLIDSDHMGRSNAQGLMANYNYYCGFFDAYRNLFGFVVRHHDGSHDVETYDGR